MTRPFRFGLQLTLDRLGDPIEQARRAQEAGFDTVLVADHVGPERLSPMVALAAVASATEHIRLGTFVLNNDMRNPTQLAWEASSLDRLSGGRFELGLGAGHTPHEYAETGVAFDPPAERKARLAESTEIIRRLLDGETVTHHGAHHRIDDAVIDRSEQDRLPLLVGGNGAALLGHAGAHADIIGLQGLGRTKEDGHRHEVKWSPERLDAQIDQIRHGAGDRFGDLELNALVQVMTVTDDIDRESAEICGRVEGLTADHLMETPYALLGTEEQIVEKLRRCRARWGISYFVVRELETFAPIIAALR